MRLIVSVTLDGRSAGTWYAVETAKRLQSRGHEVLCIPRPQGKTIAIARDAGLDVVDDCDLGNKSAKQTYANIQRLKSIARDFKPDAILAHWGTDHILWALAKTSGGGDVPLIRVRALDPRPPRKHLLSKWLHRTPTDHIVTINKRLYDAYRTRLRVPKDKITIIEAGVDPAEYQTDKKAELSRLGVPEGKSVVILLARFSPVKGHRVLLKAVRKVIDRCPDAHFLWLGYPSEYTQDQFARWFVEANTIDHVSVVDTMQPDIAAILRSCTVGIVSSVGSESVSRSLLEYFGCGLPAVATDVGGVPDLMRRGEFGILVRPDDSIALGDAICRVLEQPDQGQSMGKRAQEFVMTVGTWDKRIDDWEGLLDRVRMQFAESNS